MEPILVAVLISVFLAASFILANERFGILATDRFSTAGMKWAAYAWLTLLVLVITLLVVQSSRGTGNLDLSAVSFWSLFTLHLLLVVFLAGWWALSGRPPIERFLNLRREAMGPNVLLGVAVGVGGWIITITIALGIGLALSKAGLMPTDAKPSPVIPWMAALPIWKKALIIFSAMTVEEAFFRGWLQKRVGLVISTIVFAISHAGYGQPFLLIGVTVVSLVIGYTFYKTRNLWPCIIAHGVFDAIQLFVIVPVVLQMSGQATG